MVICAVHVNNLSQSICNLDSALIELANSIILFKLSSSSLFFEETFLNHPNQKTFETIIRRANLNVCRNNKYKPASIFASKPVLP